MVRGALRTRYQRREFLYRHTDTATEAVIVRRLPILCHAPWSFGTNKHRSTFRSCALALGPGPKAPTVAHAAAKGPTGEPRSVIGTDPTLVCQIPVGDAILVHWVEEGSLEIRAAGRGWAALRHRRQRSHLHPNEDQ